MSSFTMNFECDNAAFWDENEFSREEVASILRGVAKKVINYYHTEGALHDTNGNRVGSWSLEIDEPDEDEDADEEED